MLVTEHLITVDVTTENCYTSFCATDFPALVDLFTSLGYEEACGYSYLIVCTTIQPSTGLYQLVLGAKVGANYKTLLTKAISAHRLKLKVEVGGDEDNLADAANGIKVLYPQDFNKLHDTTGRYRRSEFLASKHLFNLFGKFFKIITE